MSIEINWICHVVRRFGLVGGMEGYVWRLAHAQLRLGYRVSIITESIHGEPDEAIQLIVVPRSHKKKRWQQMLHFRLMVAEYFRLNYEDPRPLLHSHERCSVHDVTTFHGPPMAPRRLESMFSRRVAAWQMMEKTEILGPPQSIVVPVSQFLGGQLLKKYPEASSRMVKPVYPGIEFHPRESAEFDILNNSQSRRLLFVGVDWKRKGLTFALDIFGLLRQKSDNWALDVVGPSSEKVRHTVERRNAFFLGWQDAIDYSRYDILVLPSRNEPFGMVVSEARAHGCRVICSDQVGAVELHRLDDGVIELAINLPPSHWADAIEKLMEKNREKHLINRSWTSVASEYHDSIYPLARERAGD